MTMIPRYKVKEIHDIWKTDNKLETWLNVEMAHLESMSRNITDKTLTQDEFNVIKSNISIDKDRWKEIEEETRHDVQAFVQMLEESVPDNCGSEEVSLADEDLLPAPDPPHTDHHQLQPLLVV